MALNQNNNPVFKNLAFEQVNNRNVQKYKFNYTYSVSSLVEAGQQDPQELTVEQDADFLIEKLTGSCYGPCDENGIPTASATDFPKAGIAAGAGFAGRGLTLLITDSGPNRPLTSGFQPVENLLSPGYGDQFYVPFPLKYFAVRNSTIRFDFKNRDTQARHQCDISINGYKFQMPEMPDTLLVGKKMAQNAQVAQ